MNFYSNQMFLNQSHFLSVVTSYIAKWTHSIWITDIMSYYVYHQKIKIKQFGYKCNSPMATSVQSRINEHFTLQPVMSISMKSFECYSNWKRPLWLCIVNVVVKWSVKSFCLWMKKKKKLFQIVSNSWFSRFRYTGIKIHANC